MPSPSPRLTVRPVDADNWRAVSALEVTEHQQAFVAAPAYYLALCCYDVWNPLAVYLDDLVIGFLMWAIDDDGSCWLGGVLIDHTVQRRGYGRRAVLEAVTLLAAQTGSSEFALSYHPSNLAAKLLYRSMGFVETGEMETDEVVARATLDRLLGGEA